MSIRKILSTAFVLGMVIIMAFTAADKVLARSKAPSYKLTGLRAAVTDYHLAVISWEPLTTELAEDVLSYKLERATSKNGKYKTIAAELQEPGFSDTSLKAGKTYYYRVRTLREGRCINTSGKLKVTTKKYRISDFKVKGDFHHTMNASWSPLRIMRTDGDGYETITYKLLRATSKKGKYKQVLSTSDNEISEHELKPGKTYYYKLKACIGDKCIYTTGAAKISTKAYKIKDAKASSKDFTVIRLSWGGITGDPDDEVCYEILRSTAKKGTYEAVGETTDCTYADKGLTPGKTYYYKIRGLVNRSSVYTTDYVSAKVIIEKKVKIEEFLNGDGTVFLPAIAIGEDIYETSDYNVLQGGCVHDGYAYIAMYTKDEDIAGTRCRLAKIDIETLDVVNVTEPILIYHANCITYDTRRDLLLVTACRVEWNRAIYVDPNTLEITGYKDIELRADIENLPDGVLEQYDGFTAITYDEKNDRYLGRLRAINDVIELDAELNPVSYIPLEGKRAEMMNQSVLAVDDYFYDVRSYIDKAMYNLVTIHDMMGSFVGQLKIDIGTDTKKYGKQELEFISYDNGTFYGGFARGYNKVLKTGEKIRVRIASIFKFITEIW